MRSESSKNILDVKDLRVTYASRSSPSINDISFYIRKGEFVWLAGDSASGKSTLMNSLCGFIPQIIPADVEGTISLKGKKDLSTLQLAQHICMVHQDPETQFCTEYVEDEIAFGPENRCISRRKIERRIETTLEQLNCSELRERKLHTLSGGEKQKVAIASMLVLNPSVLILDEPTSNLDQASMQEVLGAIEKVRKKSKDLTIILSEHRIGGLVEHVDRVLKLDKGELSENIADFQSLNVKEKQKFVDYSYPSYKRQPSEGRTVISIDSLCCTLNGNRILKDINAEIQKGDIIALMGRNGSGKTTLIKHIAGFLEVQEGNITIFGDSMNRSSKVPPWELGEKLAYVFQNPNHQIFENTVKSEMLFGPINFSKGISEAKNKLAQIIKNEGIEEDRHPHNLSFGQKRRLNIHSSSVHDPDIIIVDEPFSGQDHRNALKMAEILDGFWWKGKTLIIVTHDPDFAEKFCTRTLLMEDGKLICDGKQKKRGERK